MPLHDTDSLVYLASATPIPAVSKSHKFLPGVPDDLIQKGKDLKSVSEIVQNGKHFKLTITTGTKVIQNEFTLGEECELDSMTGEKIKVGGAHLLFASELPLEPSLGSS
jgi:hypothetical protein